MSAATGNRRFSLPQIENFIMEARKLRAEFAADEDETLIHDTLEGQTNLYEAIDQIGEDHLRDKLLIEAAEARIRRLKKRAERRQDWLGRKMADLGLSASQERPLFTLGLEWKSHVVVTDETTLAPRYIKHSPDKIAIAKDLRSGTFVGEGAEMSNPQPSARIYRK